MTAQAGWIKLHRQALNNGWLRNHRLWVFWSYCLLKASHRPTTAQVGFQRVPLESGQFVFGRKQAAVELGMTERQVRTCLNSLISTNNLTTKTTNKFSIISIINWHTYQDIELANDRQCDRQIDHQATSKRPANDHIQELKELKKKSLPTKIPPAGFALFRDWWMYAFSRVEVDRYIFEQGKDGSCLSSMLKSADWKEIVCKACHYFIDADRFPKGRPTLSGLKASINRYPGHINGQSDNFRELGLLPPDGILLEDWTPWKEKAPTA